MKVYTCTTREAYKKFVSSQKDHIIVKTFDDFLQDKIYNFWQFVKSNNKDVSVLIVDTVILDYIPAHFIYYIE